MINQHHFYLLRLEVCSILQRGNVFASNGPSNWADLGDLSAACITIPETCADGGTLMVWFKGRSGGLGGYLSTSSRTFGHTNGTVFGAGLLIQRKDSSKA